MASPSVEPSDIPIPTGSDSACFTHISNQIALRVPLSPIYHLLLSPPALRLVHASPGLIRAHLILGPQHLNAGGSLHGSASATIVDWAGGMAIASWDLRSGTGVSADIHVNYIGGAREGETVEIEGRAEKVGGGLAFTSVRIAKVRERGEVGPLVITATHTKYVRGTAPVRKDVASVEPSA
ncbi:Thioesterase/thiol ester dehydrase-isomerase [Eremomyces bilateralis CBS 781.70]|uniref:Thioesterase/thiol ester dehydrase-isomerase n=1 Tax=Eremomyces bilateralis CBS 781.70 TaxID=1392243 RepID=A0A6G1GEN9_9PEZI|nr:Thioesterase/thiol ester dehydrase-isomerase [Eremomyces bilateralis CBS 781.70]KAF1816339.1 Thioesterase/thiol ester dehydrase-isomerase [Eremomyces bilateralis CBS 781.70]